MFKLDYKTLRSNDFRQSMSKLVNCKDYPDYRVSYNLMRMSKSLEKHLLDSQKEWIALATPLVEKDDKGNFRIEEGDFVYKPEVDKVKAAADIEAYATKEVIIERFKLRLPDLAPAKLSPADLAAIEPLLLPIIEEVQ